MTDSQFEEFLRRSKQDSFRLRLLSWAVPLLMVLGVGLVMQVSAVSYNKSLTLEDKVNEFIKVQREFDQLTLDPDDPTISKKEAVRIRTVLGLK